MEEDGSGTVGDVVDGLTHAVAVVAMATVAAMAIAASVTVGEAIGENGFEGHVVPALEGLPVAVPLRLTRGVSPSEVDTAAGHVFADLPLLDEFLLFRAQCLVEGRIALDAGLRSLDRAVAEENAEESEGEDFRDHGTGSLL